jgi:hypothetical protein
MRLAIGKKAVKVTNRHLYLVAPSLHGPIASYLYGAICEACSHETWGCVRPVRPCAFREIIARRHPFGAGFAVPS